MWSHGLRSFTLLNGHIGSIVMMVIKNKIDILFLLSLYLYYFFLMPIKLLGHKYLLGYLALLT